jgi:hypothetical protein
MKNKFDIKSLVLGGLLSAVIMFSIGATTEKSAWDYKIIQGHLRRLGANPEPTLGQQVDQAAADGWEVVSAANEEFGPFVILRRAKWNR